MVGGAFLAVGCSAAPEDDDSASAEDAVSIQQIEEIAGQLSMGRTLLSLPVAERSKAQKIIDEGACHKRFAQTLGSLHDYRRYERGAVYFAKTGADTRRILCVDVVTKPEAGSSYSIPFSLDGMVLETVSQLGLRNLQYFDSAMGGKGGLVFAGETINGKLVGKGDIAFHAPDHTCDFVQFDASARDDGVALDDSAEYKGVAAGQAAMAKCAKETPRSVASTPEKLDQICQPKAMKACHDEVNRLVAAAQSSPSAVWNSVTSPLTPYGTLQWASVERADGQSLTLSGPIAALAYVYRVRLGKAKYTLGAAGTTGYEFDGGDIRHNAMSGRYEVHLTDHGRDEFPLECETKTSSTGASQGVATGPIVCFKPDAKLCGPALGGCSGRTRCDLETVESCQSRCRGPNGEEYPGTQVCMMDCESPTSALRQGKCVLAP
jgi:hypothetical protein